MSARKGVVIESGKGWATILLPDGLYQRIKTSHYLEVGEFYQEANLLPIKYVAAAVILLTMLLGSIDYYSVKAYAQISTLAELGVNRWGRVVSVKATDDNGQRILTEVKVNNDELEVAVEKIYSQVLKDKQNIKVPPTKPVLSIESIQKDQSRVEDKLLKKMDRGLQKAWQSQKYEDEIKDTVKNKVQPKNEISPIIIMLNETPKIPSSNDKKDIEVDILKEQMKDIEVDILKEQMKDFDEDHLEEQIKDLDDQANSIESTIKDPGNIIDSAKQLNDHIINSDLESTIANEKDKLEQYDSHSHKNKDQ